MASDENAGAGALMYVAGSRRSLGRTGPAGVFSRTACCAAALLAGCTAGVDPGTRRDLTARPALESALLLQDRFERTAAIADALKTIKAEDLETVIDVLGNEPTPPGDQALPLLWERLAELSGRYAVEKAGQIPEHRQRVETELSALRGWSRSDPEEAWRWALHSDRIPPSAHGLRPPNPYIPVLNETLVRYRTDWLIEKFLAMDEHGLRQSLARVLARHFGRYHPEGLVPIADRLRAGQSRIILLQTYLLSWARDDFQAAAAWARGQGTPPERAQWISAVIGSWLQAGEVDAALAWLLAEERGEDLDLALRRAIGSRPSPGVTDALIQKIHSDMQRDDALSSAVQLFSEDSPETAADFAARIQRPGLREHRLGQLLNHWKEIDLEAVRQFVQSSADLTEEERERYREALETPERRIQ